MCSNVLNKYYIKTHLIMWPIYVGKLNYVENLDMSNLSFRPPIVQKIDRTSLAASIAVQTTITGYNVHTI